jgi:hypothetical protein
MQFLRWWSKPLPHHVSSSFFGPFRRHGPCVATHDRAPWLGLRWRHRSEHPEHRLWKQHAPSCNQNDRIHKAIA